MEPVQTTVTDGNLAEMKKGATLAPFGTCCWLGRSAAGGRLADAASPCRGLGRHRLLGNWRVPLLGRVLEPARGLRDGLERAVEDPQRALGNAANDIVAASLKLHELEALDHDLLRQLAVHLDAKHRDALGHEVAGDLGCG